MYSHFSSRLKGGFWNKKVPFQHSGCLIANPAISARDSKWADGTALILLGFPQVLLRWPWVQGKGIGLVHEAFLHFLQGPQGQFIRIFPSHCSSAFWSTWMALWYEQEASPPTTLKKKKNLFISQEALEKKNTVGSNTERRWQLLCCRQAAHTLGANAKSGQLASFWWHHQCIKGS